MKKSVESRIKSFESLISQLKKKKYEDFEMKYVSDYSMEFIMDIEWLDLFSVFTVLKRKDGDTNINLYQTINRNLASIRDVNKLWFESYTELLNRQMEYMRRWDKSMEEIGKKTDDFVLWMKANNYKKRSNPFIDELDNIIGTHQKTKDARDIFIAIDSLIKPLHVHITSDQKQLLGRVFLDHVMACKYAYANFIKNRKHFVDQFEIYITTLNKNISEIDKNVSQLRQLNDDEPKFRHIWKF